MKGIKNFIILAVFLTIWAAGSAISDESITILQVLFIFEIISYSFQAIRKILRGVLKEIEINLR